jgi:hypothetical protein
MSLYLAMEGIVRYDKVFGDRNLERSLAVDDGSIGFRFYEEPDSGYINVSGGLRNYDTVLETGRDVARILDENSRKLN